MALTQVGYEESSSKPWVIIVTPAAFVKWGRDAIKVINKPEKSFLPEA
jgi:hypothetical protein